jgi:hypothetical protein
LIALAQKQETKLFAMDNNLLRAFPTYTLSLTARSPDQWDMTALGR